MNIIHAADFKRRVSTMKKYDERPPANCVGARLAWDYFTKFRLSSRSAIIELWYEGARWKVKSTSTCTFQKYNIYSAETNRIKRMMFNHA